MRTSALFAFLLALGASACSAPEEVPPPQPAPPDPVREARLERTRSWTEAHGFGCVADVVEVEMPAEFREHCTFDSRGELYKRVDSSDVRTASDGRQELVLQTLLEAQTPNTMAARCLLGKAEFAALRKLRIVFSSSATEVSVRAAGHAVWWIDAPAQRQRAASAQLVLPPRNAGAP